MSQNEIGMLELVSQQKITNRLLAAQLRDRLNQQDLIALLDNCGVSSNEIGDVIGMSGHSVRAARSKLKKSVK